MPHTYDDFDLQADEDVRCIGRCTGCALPGHRCCDVQARLDGLQEAVYEERDRLLNATNEADTHARARMLQLRRRVMNNDFDIVALQVPARGTWCPCSDCILFRTRSTAWCSSTKSFRIGMLFLIVQRCSGQRMYST